MVVNFGAVFAGNISWPGPVLAWGVGRSRLLTGGRGAFSSCIPNTRTVRGTAYVSDGGGGAEVAFGATAPACSSDFVLVYLRSGEEALALRANLLVEDVPDASLFARWPGGEPWRDGLVGPAEFCAVEAIVLDVLSAVKSPSRDVVVASCREARVVRRCWATPPAVSKPRVVGSEGVVWEFCRLRCRRLGSAA